jgi:hypothetical protein
MQYKKEVISTQHATGVEEKIAAATRMGQEIH